MEEVAKHNTKAAWKLASETVKHQSLSPNYTG